MVSLFKMTNGTFDRAANGDFVRISGREALKQRVYFRLQTMRGEWFLDRTLGPDYKGKFLVRQFGKSEAERDVRADLLRIDDIKTIESVKATIGANQQIVGLKVVYKDIYGSDGVTVEA